MRAFLSSIILFFYTLTCTGATIYMHQCHGGSLLMLQENAPSHHLSCPICLDHHHGEDSSTDSCDMTDSEDHCCDEDGKDDCCKDIQIDLKKGQEEVESTPSPFNTMTLSPATLSIIWIVLFQPYADTIPEVNGQEHAILARQAPPTYLLHCNFRI